MGKFAETAIVDYRLPIADPGKLTLVFHLQQTKESLPFSVCSKQPELGRFPLQ